MKAWQLNDFGLENLVLSNVNLPEPKPNEIVVKVSAVSLNYRDKAIVDGIYEPEKMPKGLIPVADAAGVVVQTGSAVTRFTEGDRVASHLYSRWIDGAPAEDEPDFCLGGPINGGLAEYMLLEETAAVASPDVLTDEEVSTLPIAALTPWFSMVENGKLRAGQTVVVQGTGGVSIFAAQIASAYGARVIATSSSDDKLSRIAALGATDLINYNTTPDWATRVRELTDGVGADQVLDVVGGDGLNKSIAAARPTGLVSVIGFLSGQTSNLDLMQLIFNKTRIQGIAVGHRRAFEEMNEFFEKHTIKPVIEKVYGFDEVHEAYEHLSRGAFGKVVIRVG
ncbi:zinc-dependent alcohol dehydrogenase family protein [Rhodococcus sp. NBC_00294]|uniref:zinc-dependent alcohol dehydrogenase family protein n=1 Tax=Rhodococcus sp. NBC_00294 TaxID=2976004 RepID=UPI002E2B9563|nr:NAD(P)-dependent alcohol dehydrogenase [Rhodococcus sp. NBC_00294]